MVSFGGHQNCLSVDVRLCPLNRVKKAAGDRTPRGFRFSSRGFRGLLAAFNESVQIFTPDSDSARADARESETAFESPPFYGANRDAEEFRHRFIVQVFVSHCRLRLSFVLRGRVEIDYNQKRVGSRRVRRCLHESLVSF